MNTFCQCRFESCSLPRIHIFDNSISCHAHEEVFASVNQTQRLTSTNHITSELISSQWENY